MSTGEKITRVQFTDEELKVILMLVGNSLDDGAEEWELDPAWVNRLLTKLVRARRRLQ